MRRLSVLLAALALVAATPLRAQTAADSAAIRRAALDYIEGWYEGDTTRMARAVHPQLAKRFVRTDAQGRSTVRDMSASVLVAQTGEGGGRDIPTAQRRKDVVILDIYRDIATARVTSAELVDYMHLARVDGRWRIINVLWAVQRER